MMRRQPLHIHISTLFIALIITVGSGVTWLALSGVILLFRSFRRQDFAYLLDPIERLREGRWKG